MGSHEPLHLRNIVCLTLEQLLGNGADAAGGLWVAVQIFKCLDAALCVALNHDGCDGGIGIFPGYAHPGAHPRHTFDSRI